MASLKTFSKRFREEILNYSLQTPPDIVTGIADVVGSGAYQSYIASRGFDTIINSNNNNDPGTVDGIGVAQRKMNLDKNLKTPNDITENIPNISQTHSDIISWTDGLGQETSIASNSVTNPGDVDDAGDQARKENMVKNKHINRHDVADGGQSPTVTSIDSMTFTNLRATIGEPTTIGVLNVPNPDDLDLDTVRDPKSGSRVDKRLFDIVNFNKYIPTAGFNIFDNSIVELRNQLNQSNDFWTDDKFDQPSSFWSDEKQIGFQPQTYVPGDFVTGTRFNLDDGATFDLNPVNLQESFIEEDIASLIGGGPRLLSGDSLLMNIAALELQFNFNHRIQDALVRETALRTSLDEAMTNPATALNILKDPKNTLFEKNYDISVGANPVSKAVDLTNRLIGVTSPYYLSGLDDFFESPYRDVIMPSCFSPAPNKIQTTGSSSFFDSIGKLYRDITGESIRKKDRDAWILNRTGAGQKSSLFQSLTFNRYQPDYVPDYETGLANGVFQVIDELKGLTGFLGFTEGRRPGGNYYVGSHDFNDTIDILQDEEMFQARSNESLTKEWEVNYRKDDDNPYDFEGEGLVKIGDYGILESEFVWASENTLENAELDEFTRLSQNRAHVSWQYRDKFRECSLLDTTQKLLDRNTVTTQIIDQVRKEFGDEYSNRISRGSAVKTIDYQIDETGRRIYPTHQDIQKGGEMCRVWTKDHKYGPITTTMRYKELLRKERNSVLDRYGNLNIFPSPLNVNEGYGSPSLKTQDGKPIVTEDYGEKRARKYMLSLENLAWKGSDEEVSLPPCEKGPNGGRIMWFPPYDVQATDNSSANWNSTVFLGRPEPVYTYNSTERVGTLAFKLAVDHPSMLNLLVRHELAKLDDKQVDDILDAFWSGCIEYDVFELARMWGVFSIEEIEYFKSIIDSIKRDEENLDVLNEIDKVKVEVLPKTKLNLSNGPESDFHTNAISLESEAMADFSDTYLFFENDIPLNNVEFANVESFDIYYNTYVSNMNNSDGVSKNKTYFTNVNNTNSKAFFERYDLGFGTTYVKNNVNNNSTTISFEDYVKDSYTNFKTNWLRVVNESQGYHLKLKFEAFASPVASDDYNEKLAKKRFIAAVKTLIGITDGSKLNLTSDSFKKNPDLLADVFSDNYTTAKFYKPGYGGNFDKITITNIEAREENSLILEGKPPMIQTMVIDGEQIPYYNMEYDLPNSGGTATLIIVNEDNVDNVYNYLTETQPSLDITITDELVDGRIGVASISGRWNGQPYEASLVAATVSPIASYSRRVHFSNDIEYERNIPELTTEQEKEIAEARLIITQDSTLVPEDNEKVKFGQVTKRDIAQRILNKLVSECDYFDYLSEEYPGVFSSVKEKLKYFSPAFHSMTPEGLNSRLTFLQQCVRPGKTIQNKNDDFSCDANNTAFGKPPICILRIGDFYHSKIVINDLNITYDPLIFDLNPEGIGVQPMIANVNLAFKFIGGQGLRKPVEQLQNALSFNYYANADVYDDRTFANNDEFERSLLNTEASFFDNGELDLQNIVNSVANITDLDEPLINPEGTIGQLVTGTAGSELEFPTSFNPTTDYLAGELVYFDQIIYQATSNITADSTNPDVNDSWEIYDSYDMTRGREDNSIATYPPFLVPKKGLYPYHKEYGNNYVEYHKFDYRNNFEDLYNNVNLLYEYQIGKYNHISDKLGTSLLNNPFLTAGILMKDVTKYGRVPINYYGGTENQLLNSILSLPLDYTKDGSVVTEYKLGGSGSTTTITTGKVDEYSKIGGDGDIKILELQNQNYYQVGVDKHGITNGEPQLMLLHLYPQTGNYKLPSKGSYTEGIGLVANAELKYPNDQFVPNAFKNLELPKPDINNINDITDKWGILSAIADVTFNLIENENLAVLHSDMVNPSNSFNYNNLRKSSIFTDIRRTLVKKLISNFETNLDNYWDLYREFVTLGTSGDTTPNQAYFNTVKGLDELAVVLNGFDVSIDKDNTAYFEVVPNGVTGNTGTITNGVYTGAWDTYFGYNPYTQIQGVVSPTITVTNTEIDDVNKKINFKNLEYKLGSTVIAGSSSDNNYFESQSIDTTNLIKTYDINDVTTYMTEIYTPKIDGSVGDVSIYQHATDYFLNQMDQFTANSTATEGKTRYYGLPYINSSYEIAYEPNTTNVNLTGVIVDRVLDNVNFSGDSDINYTGTDVLVGMLEGLVYYSDFGNTYKSSISENGIVLFTHKNENTVKVGDEIATNPAMSTTFERMNHEMVVLGNKLSAMKKLDIGSNMLNINTIFEDNTITYEGNNSTISGYVDTLNSTNKDAAYTFLGMETYSNYPVVNMGISTIGYHRMNELTKLFTFDTYFTSDELTSILNVTISPMEIPKIKLVDNRNFEEIFFANFIYYNAETVVEELITKVNEKVFKEFKRTQRTNDVPRNERRKKQFEAQKEKTLKFLEILLANITKVQTDMKNIYDTLDTNYRKITNLNNSVVEEIKPEVIPTAIDEYAYQLKMRKTTSISTVNKVLLNRYIKTRRL